MKQRITPELSDSIFEGIEIPDDVTVRRQTAVAKRELSGWHEKNRARLNDEEYHKRLSESLRTSEKVLERNRTQKSNPKWCEAHSKGVKEYLSSPDYVNPRGMLGKKRSEESKRKAAEKMKGRAKNLEGNDKLRKYHIGKKLKESTRKKLSEINTGKETDRCRRVQTPKGQFEKLKLAAEAYNVTTGAIKLWTKTKPKEFYFIDDMNVLGARKIQTPEGIFNNSSDAAKFYSISNAAIRYRIKHWDTWCYLDEKTNFKQK